MSTLAVIEEVKAKTYHILLEILFWTRAPQKHEIFELHNKKIEMP